tara:strand:- start:830 stop:1270 length:441 start_codon:yes stop_codon:yes gene_type:complete
MKIVIAGDHAAFDAKSNVIKHLESKGVLVEDLGTNSHDSVDYPVYGQMVAKHLLAGHSHRGIIICGTGIGISIAANRFKNIRATLCSSELDAEMARKHNDSNVLALGARTTDIEKIKNIIDVWLSTDFEGGRHQDRLELIDGIENE